MGNDRIDQFVSDAAAFCKNLRRALARLQQEPGNRDLVHEAFRFVHSLKSESQFLGLDELGAVAHEMEGTLEQIRRGTLAVDSNSLGFLSRMVDAIESLVPPIGETAAPDLPETVSSEQGTQPHRPDTERRGVEFTEFERKLIREARARGERLFRMVCEIDESAPLKYPKAYLIVNNLELITNVIRSAPPFESSSDEAFHRFEVYFASGLAEDDILDCADVDQVEIASIAEVPYEVLETELPSERERRPVSARRSPSSVRVENGRLDAILFGLRNLSAAVEHLRRYGARTAVNAEMEAEMLKITRMILSLERLVDATRRLSISEELQRMPTLVRDLATRLKKRVRLAVVGESVRVDRRLLAMLSEPLVHLVKNAVDHGIETPEERIAAGKDPVGRVLISAQERGDELLLEVGDDGRGISPARVRKRARELGIATNGTSDGSYSRQQSGGPTGAGPADAGKPDDILDVLVRPGFSTRTEATPFSGRGVGLDAIYQKVRQSLGGELRLISEEGRGTRFTISVPSADSMMSLLVVRSGQETVGIPLRDVEAVVDAGSSSFQATREGFLTYEGLPLLSLSGRLTSDASTEHARHVVVLGRDETRIAFLCDELLFERDLPEGRLTVAEEVESGLRRVNVGESEADFLFLDISAIA